MPNFAYATVPVNIGAAGNIVAPTLAGSAQLLQFPAGATATAQQNVRSATQAAALRAAYPQAVPIADVTIDANLASLLATGIGASGSWSSPVLPSFGWPHTSLALASNKGGTVVLSTFADTLGALLVTSTTLAMTANATCVLDNTSTQLMQSYGYVINNTAASNAVISSAIALLASK